ncbi:porin [Psychromonas ossibalaenae]|uniref:porin n=1 Tax=Psychromonas ossibalaenae TaxID=444922 RepID=UPI00037EA660|nr:porin [Psychromonas ossibalaenae]
MFKKKLLITSILASVIASPVLAKEDKEGKKGDDIYSVQHDTQVKDSKKNDDIGIYAVEHKEDVEQTREDEPIELYGQVAISLFSLGEDGKDTVNRIENESRIGFRGEKEMARAPKLVWQIEGNNVGWSDNEGDGQFGLRDTYAGFTDEKWGLIKFGRFTTPLYDIVDWPYSNPGLGNVFDWGADIEGGANYDRQSDQISWESPVWSGFSVVTAIGRGNNPNDSDSNFVGGSAHYTQGPLKLHLGYEYGTGRLVNVEDTSGETDGKTAQSEYTTYIAGYELNFKNGIGLFGAYKVMTAEYSDYSSESLESEIGSVQDQTAYSVGALYSTGYWQFKIGYAANSDLEIDSVKVADTADNVISGQAMYFIDDDALIYLRLKAMELDSVDYTEARLGLEYYF